jgi:hypothetical protein
MKEFEVAFNKRFPDSLADLQANVSSDFVGVKYEGCICLDDFKTRKCLKGFPAFVRGERGLQFSSHDGPQFNQHLRADDNLMLLGQLP